MKRLNLSALILSAGALTFGLPTFAQAQDEIDSEGGTVAQDNSEPLPMPEQSPPAEIPDAPSEDRPYDAPLNDDPEPVDTQGDNWSKPPVESGPDVDSRYNSTDGSTANLWSYLRIGPTIQLGFPHPLTYGIDALLADVVSFGFSTGNYKVTQIDKASIQIKSWDIHARWHPWSTSFFLGGAYGNQDIKGTFEDTFDLTVAGVLTPVDVPVQVDARIKSSYFTPHLGWMAVYDSGFTLGFEIGAQIPISPETSVEAKILGPSAAYEDQVKATSDYKDLKKQADDTVKILGKKTIPYVTLLKMGWLF